MAVSAILGAAGLGLAIYGEVKKSQAEKRAKANLANRPTYNALPEDDSELNLAEQQASQGMGAGARQQLQNNADRTLATGANAIMMGGGNPNQIANLAEKTQSVYDNNAIYDDQVRQQHIGNLLGTYNYYNGQRQGNADKSFQINDYAPWTDRQQLYSSQIAGGQQTMNSGLNMAGKALGGFQGTGGGDPNVSNQLYAQKEGTVSQVMTGASGLFSGAGRIGSSYPSNGIGQAGVAGANSMGYGVGNAASNYPGGNGIIPFYGGTDE